MPDDRDETAAAAVDVMMDEPLKKTRNGDVLATAATARTAQPTRGRPRASETKDAIRLWTAVARASEPAVARASEPAGFGLAYVSFGQTTLHWDKNTIGFGAVMVLNTNDDASAIVIDTGPSNHRNVAVDTSGGSTFMLFDNKNMPHGSIGGEGGLVFSACLDERLFKNIATFTTWKSVVPWLAVAPEKKPAAAKKKKKKTKKTKKPAAAAKKMLAAKKKRMKMATRASPRLSSALEAAIAKTRATAAG